MSYIEETSKIPCLYDVDVLVCGGGPAGIGAAGTAVALSIKQDIKLRDVSVKEIQEIVGE